MCLDNFTQGTNWTAGNSTACISAILLTMVTLFLFHIHKTRAMSYLNLDDGKYWESEQKSSWQRNS